MNVLRPQRSFLPPPANLAPILDDPRVKQDVLPDGTHVWQSVHFDGQLKLSRAATLRGLYQTVKWLRKVNQSLDQDPTQWAYGRYASRWGQSIISEGNLCLKVKGLEQLEEGAIYLFAPTHHSYIDSPLLYTALENWKPGFLADESFQYYPSLGKPMIASKRHVFVDRTNPQSLLGKIKSAYRKAKAKILEIKKNLFNLLHLNNNSKPSTSTSPLAALRNAVKLLSREGNQFSFVVFPQGTRSLGQTDSQGARIDGYLLPEGKKLSDGIAEIFLLTAQHNVKLVPVVINGSGRVLPKGSFQTQTGDSVEIIIGKPRALQEFGEIPKHGSANEKRTKRAEIVKNIMSDIEYFYAQNYHEVHIEPPK